MATTDQGAASRRPRHRYTLTTWEDGTTSALGATVEIRTVRDDLSSGVPQDSVIDRAEIDVDYDHLNDEVVVTVRRLEDDPTVKVVFV